MDSGEIGRDMERVYLNGRMEISMMVIGLMEIGVVEVNLFGRMEISI